MRTTLDIAEDVLVAAKEIARRERSTAGEVISNLARVALTQIAERLTPERRELYGQAFETFAATLNHMQGSGPNRRSRYRSGSGYQIIARLFL